jgi:pimeloyl-ACP methyl ester carboxylesterase
MAGERIRVDSGGVGISVEVHGPPEGTPVVLLHGFPDSGRMWHHQVRALTGAGFRVIVPDLRGYGHSDQPKEVDDYNLVLLAGDVTATLDHLGLERAHVVGHDWGAALAWILGSMAPERVDHLVALSVGNPVAFAGAGFEQREKSWYMLLFQFEGVAEEWLSNDDWANTRAWAHHPDMDAVIAEFEANGSLTPALNWYRANVPPRTLVDPPLQLPAVAAPTMGIWSSGDFALNERQMTDSSAFVSGPWRYERIEGPGHWIQLEAPDEVNRLLLDFLPVR